MTQKQLERMLAEWQPRLGLADWSISIRLCRATEMGGNLSLGTCEHVLKRKAAWIRILDPRDSATTPAETLAEIEDTLVHELCHCLFAPFEATDWEGPIGIAQEQVIDALARGFVRTKRAYEKRVHTAPSRAKRGVRKKR